MDEGDFRFDADGTVHVYSGGTWKQVTTDYPVADFELKPDGSVVLRGTATGRLSPGEYVVPRGGYTGRVGFVGEPVASRPPRPRTPTDSLGTPVHTAISFVEMVVIELLDRDGVAEMVHMKLNGKINNWAEANGYTVTQVDVEADRGTATFHHVSVRATAHLIPREDGEWPSIRQAVHQDQTELAQLRAGHLSSLGDSFASAADAMTTFSDRMDAFSAAFRPWSDPLPAPPPAEPCSDPCCTLLSSLPPVDRRRDDRLL